MDRLAVKYSFLFFSFQLKSGAPARVLFPVALVDFETIKTWECFDADTGKDLARELREYFIPSFQNWKDENAFEDSFQRLLRDLQEDEEG